MTPEIQKLLEDLRGQDVILRKQAAEQLGKLDVSYPEVVKALLDAGWDNDQEVAAAARNALKNPVHQAMGNQLWAPAAEQAKKNRGSRLRRNSLYKVRSHQLR